MAVRDATPDDAAACRDVHAPHVTGSAVSFEAEPPTAEEMARRIAAAQERHAWLVLEDAGSVRGFSYGGPFTTREAYRWSCAVSVHLEPGRRRTGAGRALGFEPAGTDRRVGFENGAWHDVAWLQRDLGPGPSGTPAERR